jgi:transposase
MEDDGLCGHFCLCPQRGIVDTSEQPLQGRGPGGKKVWRTKAERRAIVEETLVPGASVSRVARRHDVNANQVFRWRKLYSEGQLGTTTNFLPVKIANEPTLEARKENDLFPGTMEIQLCKGTLRISGSVDVLTLRAVIESLVG